MKTIEEFIELFSEQFDQTDRSVFYPEKRFREIEEWSSLIALSIIAMVDEEFGIILKGEDIKNSITIEDIYMKIATK